MKLFLLAGIMISCFQPAVFSQNIGISVNGATPHASAMLDISDTSRGILIPRMSMAQRQAIASPAKGLMVLHHKICGLCCAIGKSRTGAAKNDC